MVAWLSTEPVGKMHPKDVLNQSRLYEEIVKIFGRINVMVYAPVQRWAWNGSKVYFRIEVPNNQIVAHYINKLPKGFQERYKFSLLENKPSPASKLIPYDYYEVI